MGWLLGWPLKNTVSCHDMGQGPQEIVHLLTRWQHKSWGDFPQGDKDKGPFRHTGMGEKQGRSLSVAVYLLPEKKQIQIDDPRAETIRMLPPASQARLQSRQIGKQAGSRDVFPTDQADNLIVEPGLFTFALVFSQVDGGKRACLRTGQRVQSPPGICEVEGRVSQVGTQTDISCYSHRSACCRG